MSLENPRQRRQRIEAWQNAGGSLAPAPRSALPYFCHERHPEYPEQYQCNRERGHGGDHCYNKKNDYTHEYENHWWPQRKCGTCGV